MRNGDAVLVSATLGQTLIELILVRRKRIFKAYEAVSGREVRLDQNTVRNLFHQAEAQPCAYVQRELTRGRQRRHHRHGGPKHRRQQPTHTFLAR